MTFREMIGEDEYDSSNDNYDYNDIKEAYTFIDDEYEEDDEEEDDDEEDVIGEIINNVYNSESSTVNRREYEIPLNPKLFSNDRPKRLTKEDYINSIPVNMRDLHYVYFMNLGMRYLRIKRWPTTTEVFDVFGKDDPIDYNHPIFYVTKSITSIHEFSLAKCGRTADYREDYNGPPETNGIFNKRPSDYLTYPKNETIKELFGDGPVDYSHPIFFYDDNELVDSTLHNHMTYEEFIEIYKFNNVSHEEDVLTNSGFANPDCYEIDTNDDEYLDEDDIKGNDVIVDRLFDVFKEKHSYASKSDYSHDDEYVDNDTTFNEPMVLNVPSMKKKNINNNTNTFHSIIQEYCTDDDNEYDDDDDDYEEDESIEYSIPDNYSIIGDKIVYNNVTGEYEDYSNYNHPDMYTKPSKEEVRKTLIMEKLPILNNNNLSKNVITPKKEYIQECNAMRLKTFMKNKKKTKIKCIELLAEKEHYQNKLSKMNIGKKKHHKKIVEMRTKISKIDEKINRLIKFYNIDINEIRNNIIDAIESPPRKSKIKKFFKKVGKWFSNNFEAIIMTSALVVSIGLKILTLSATPPVAVET